MTPWPPGPPVTVGPDRAQQVDWRIASTAGVFAPLPGALLMALVEADPEAVLTNLISLTFPMTLIVAGQFLLAREHGLIGWFSFLVAGAVSAGVMYFVLKGAAPPPNLEALKSGQPLRQVESAGAVARFVVPGLLTGAAFWLVVRLSYPAVYEHPR